MRWVIAALALGLAACGESTSTTTDTADATQPGGYILEIRATNDVQTYLVTAPDGRIVVYGFANTSGFGLEQKFEFGTYVEGSSGWYIDPFKTTAVRSGTLAGSRIVGVQGGTAYLKRRDVED